MEFDESMVVCLLNTAIDRYIYGSKEQQEQAIKELADYLKLDTYKSASGNTYVIERY